MVSTSPSEETRLMSAAAEKFQKLLRTDHRYDAEAYSFVYDALDYTLRHVVPASRRAKGQHVAGPELLEGIRRYGIEQFGCLARAVF
ncbi:MAG TPA: Minf_1886 family protein, partial [Planctomycetota bacterium]|nr:Minf_1886 family protein [Planctomycetota bacterium]